LPRLAYPILSLSHKSLFSLAKKNPGPPLADGMNGGSGDMGPPLQVDETVRLGLKGPVLVASRLDLRREKRRVTTR